MAEMAAEDEISEPEEGEFVPPATTNRNRSNPHVPDSIAGIMNAAKGGAPPPRKKKVVEEESDDESGTEEEADSQSDTDTDTEPEN